MRRGKGGEVAKANITFFLVLPKVYSPSPLTSSTAFGKIVFMLPSASLMLGRWQTSSQCLMNEWLDY